MDKIGIYNMAIGRIGGSQFVQSPDEQSNQRITCDVYFDNCLERVLTAFPWNFADRKASLADIGSPPQEWLYRYRYPNDCQKVRAVVPDLSSLSSFLTKRAVAYYGICNFYPFRVIGDEANNGKAILSNLKAPFIWYTAKITNLGLWSADATSALGWLLAAEIAGPLASKPEYADMAGKAYKAALLEAGSLNMNEGQPYINRESEIVAARE